jgi:hypothetical protein
MKMKKKTFTLSILIYHNWQYVIDRMKKDENIVGYVVEKLMNSDKIKDYFFKIEIKKFATSHRIFTCNHSKSEIINSLGLMSKTSFVISLDIR